MDVSSARFQQLAFNWHRCKLTKYLIVSKIYKFIVIRESVMSPMILRKRKSVLDRVAEENEAINAVPADLHGVVRQDVLKIVSR